jgi:hypothetical protein
MIAPRKKLCPHRCGCNSGRPNTAYLVAPASADTPLCLAPRVIEEGPSLLVARGHIKIVPHHKNRVNFVGIALGCGIAAEFLWATQLSRSL